MALAASLLLAAIAAAELGLACISRAALFAALAGLSFSNAAQILFLAGECRKRTFAAAMAWISCFVAAGLGGVLVLHAGPVALPPRVVWSVTGALLLAASAWIIARAMIRTTNSACPGAVSESTDTLAGTSSEQAFVNVVAAISLGLTGIVPQMQIWCAEAILVWTAALSAEAVLRLVFASAQQGSLREALVADFVVRRLFRAAVAGRPRPETDGASADALAADSVASMWLRQLCASCALLTLLLWGTSGLVVVGPHEMGVYERLGHFNRQPLLPGLHCILPYPFGHVRRLPVKRIEVMTIGFAAKAHDLLASPLLWTKPHGEEEYALLVGTGAEAVIINAVVRYKIGERPDELRRYVTKCESPKIALRALAHQALLVELRGVSLDGVLVSDRAGLGKGLENRLRTMASAHELGLAIVDAEILSIHPPVEVSRQYADIVNARIDAQKSVTEAEVFAKSELIRCSMMSDSLAADARAAAAKRLAGVHEETSRFLALLDLFVKYPEVVRARLLGSTLAAELQNRPLILIDAGLPENVQVWLDDGSSQRTPRAQQ